MITTYDLTPYTTKTFHDIPLSTKYHNVGRYSPEMEMFKRDMQRRFISAMRVEIQEDVYMFTASVPELVRIPRYINIMATAITAGDISFVQTQNVMVFDARKYRLQTKFSPSTPKSIVKDAFVEETKRRLANGPFNSWLNKHLFMIITRNLTTNKYNWPEYNIL